MKLPERCQNVHLLVSDVDGVLTDGLIVYNNQGIEIKRFHVRDGMGVRLWQRAGGVVALVTSRSSHIVKLRAAELDIAIVRQGSEEKLAITKQIADELRLKPEQVCYIGDDLPDLAAMQYAGLAIAVADAAPEIKAAAHYVTATPGGKGALREAIEMILKNQRRWEQLIQKYGASGPSGG